MTDRELLELAAKASGIYLHVWGSKGNENFADMDKGSRWNPLTDDGDALRLGAAIEMELEINKGHVYCRSVNGPDGGISEFDKTDTLQAMRRAIVRAAAEIGKKMP